MERGRAIRCGRVGKRAFANASLRSVPGGRKRFSRGATSPVAVPRSLSPDLDSPSFGRDRSIIIPANVDYHRVRTGLRRGCLQYLMKGVGLDMCTPVASDRQRWTTVVHR